MHRKRSVRGLMDKETIGFGEEMDEAPGHHYRGVLRTTSNDSKQCTVPMKVIWQISEDYQRWRDFTTHLQDYVEKQWQERLEKQILDHKLVIEYVWEWKKGDNTVWTPYEIVFECNGTITQENKNTHRKRTVRRLMYEETIVFDKEMNKAPGYHYSGVLPTPSIDQHSVAQPVHMRGST